MAPRQVGDPPAAFSSSSAVPPGNCVTHGYHGRTYCPRCSTSALPPPPLTQAPSAAFEHPYETEAELARVIEEARRALAELVRDWENGGHSYPRINGCGDTSCGYASCRLARALGGAE